MKANQQTGMETGNTFTRKGEYILGKAMTHESLP